MNTLGEYHMKYKWSNPTVIWEHNNTHGAFNIPIGKDKKGDRLYGYHDKEPKKEIAEMLKVIEMRINDE